jgi:endonuclease/exonuclease/phosphatase (EEP) superfamily protein YafD
MSKRFLAGLLIASALLSIALTLVGFAAGRTWPAELTTHFRVQYLAGQLIIGVALAALGYRRWLAALLPAALLNALLIGPYLLPQTQALGAGPALRLMTVNLAARNRSFDGLLNMVARENPDVILLLEYTPWAQAALQPLHATYRYSTESVQADPFGIALFSREPLAQVRSFALGETMAVDARFDGPGGPVRLLGVHLLPPTTAAWFHERNAQLDRLAAIARGRQEPIVVLGDFNLSPYSPFFGDWLDAAHLEDTLAGRGLDFSWPSFFPPLGVPIDHCIVSPEFAVLARRRLEDFGSDHLPLLIELSQD